MDTEPTGFEMSEDDFNTFTQALSAKVVEDGGNPANNSHMNVTLQRWWGLVTDIPAARAYCDEQTLQTLVVERKRQDDARADLDAEITRLEGDGR